MSVIQSTPPRRRHRLAALGAALALAAVPAVAGTSAEAASCAVTWGSLAKTSAPLVTGRVAAVRAGHHPCYDRLVLDMTGRAPGYDVRYVRTVYTEGGGFPVPLAGGARLAVVVRKGATRIPTMPSVAGYPTFRQVRWAGSFEGYTTIGLGVRARLPFRVFTLVDSVHGTSRLVVDVAHHW
ncbi:hypothetical protein [Phycicoccus sp.]|uniref:AMIN-like domain-containing (lipo)protein n=1 Tax=Phycicoccus sp. TaxID=1902410 RepID=UPI002C99BA35|nr:hypothetical protein [Phycicoccus sp.]HMM95607.1 hypothetical protein [Phycicoccus sp.]